MEVVVLEIAEDENDEAVLVRLRLCPLFLDKAVQIIRFIILNRVRVNEHSANLRCDKTSERLFLMAFKALLANSEVLGNTCAARQRDEALNFDVRRAQLPHIELQFSKGEPEGEVNHDPCRLQI